MKMRGARVVLASLMVVLATRGAPATQPERDTMHFTHEHQELQRNLKRFIDSDINPYVDEWEAAEMFPAKQLFK